MSTGSDGNLLAKWRQPRGNFLEEGRDYVFASG